MHYMTIVLESIKARPAMHERLRRNKMLLPTVERLAKQLKASHEAWMARLSRTRPASESQVASEALELALRQLGLSSASPATAEDEPFRLEEAMAYLRRHTLPA